MDSESDSTANTINGEVKEGAKKLNEKNWLFVWLCYGES